MILPIVIIASIILIAIVFTASQLHRYNRPFTVELSSPIGFVRRDSVREGDNVEVFYHSDAPIEVDIYALRERKEHVASMTRIPGRSQDPTYSPRTGFQWSDPLSIPTEGYRPGYYLAELRKAGVPDCHQVPFIVKPGKPARVAVIASTNTWQAYNEFGGRSNYLDTQTPVLIRILKVMLRLSGNMRTLSAVRLPFNRPGSQVIAGEDPAELFNSHLLRGEWVLAGFLDAHDVPYAVYSDRDFAFSYDMHSSDVIIFNTHSEYWSSEMMGKLRQYIASGGKAIFASGNNMFRQVEFTENCLVVTKQQIGIERTTSLTGACYTDPGYGTYASYHVSDASHWIFEDTGVANGDHFGTYSANGGGGASGWETDKVNEFTEGFVTVAVGDNDPGPAYIVVKETSSGGWVINMSSVSFVGALFHDEVIDRMMLNIIQRGLSSEPASRHSIDLTADGSVDRSGGDGDVGD